MPRWGKRSFRIKGKSPKKQKRRFMFIIFVIFLLLSLQTFLYIEKNLEPILMSIAKARVKQIATEAVNDTISKKIAQNNNYKDLLQFEKDGEGKIRAVVFNYSEYARIVAEATERVENTLKELSKLEERIKLGAAFNSEILADFGPEIPITIIPIGSVEVNPNPKYQNAGINGIIMTVMMDVTAEVQVVIPFVSEPTIITTSIPIVQTQIFGEVPQFYYDGKGTYYGNYPSSNNASNAPPIQIVPNVPFAPGSQITPPDALPSSGGVSGINEIPGLEPFYPLVPRNAVPSSGSIQ